MVTNSVKSFNEFKFFKQKEMLMEMNNKKPTGPRVRASKFGNNTKVVPYNDEW